MSEEMAEYKVNYDPEKCRRCDHKTVCKYKQSMAKAEKIVEQWRDGKIGDDPVGLEVHCVMFRESGGIR